MSDDEGTLLADADPAELGLRLRTARRAKGLTQEQLAGTDISPTYISRIEAGQRRPELGVATLLARRLDTSVGFLATGIDPADADEARLVIRHAELALRTGDRAGAERQLRQLRDSQTELGPLSLEATWVHALALESLGQLDEAALLLEQLAADPLSARTLEVGMALSRCYREAGDLNRAIDVGERARAAADELGLAGSDLELRLTVTVVAAYYERGDVLYAAQLCQQAVQRAESQASSSGQSAAYWNASIIAADRGRNAEAVSLAERALSLMGEHDDATVIGRLRLQLGLVLLGQRPPDVLGARAQLLQARQDLVISEASVMALARCDVGLAESFMMNREFDDATTYADSAIAMLAGQHPFALAEAHVINGRVAGAQGDTDGARRHYRQAVAVLTGANADREAAQLWFQLGALLEGVGDDSGSREAYRSAGASVGLRSADTVTAALTV